MNRFRNALDRLYGVKMGEVMRQNYDYALALDAEIGAVEPSMIANPKGVISFEDYVRLNDRLDRYIGELSRDPNLRSAMNGSDLDIDDMLKRPVGRA